MRVRPLGQGARGGLHSSTAFPTTPALLPADCGQAHVTCMPQTSPRRGAGALGLLGPSSDSGTSDSGTVTEADAGGCTLDGVGLGDPHQLRSSLGLCNRSASAEPPAVSHSCPRRSRSSSTEIQMSPSFPPSAHVLPSSACPSSGSHSRPLLNKGPVAMVNNPHIKALQKRRGRRVETQRSHWEPSRGRGGWKKAFS